jgi:surfactin family lipopeptide synthetase A
VVIVFQCHHAIIDGWSDSLLMTELNNLYMELTVNPGYRPEKLKTSYRDFIIQHEVDKRNTSIKKFWKEELSGCKRLDLFTDEYDHQSLEHMLDSEGLQKLQSLADNLGVTIKEISLGAYLYLLSVLNHTPEVLAGLVTNTRLACEDGDKVLGCFLNAIPVRVTIDSGMECSEFIRQVHDKMVELKEYERLSLLQIADLHNHQVGRNPFFDTFFNFVDFHSFKSVKNEAAIAKDGTSSLVNIGGSGSTNTYFELHVNTTGGGYRAILQLNRKLRCGLSAEGLLNLYFLILDHIISNPSHPVGQAHYLSSEEKSRLAAQLNRETGVRYVAQRNEIEEKLAFLWSGILETSFENTGTKDSTLDFADSSKAERLISGIEKEFGTRLYVEDVLAEPTIAAIAARIERLLWVKGAAELPEEDDPEADSMVF